MFTCKQQCVVSYQVGNLPQFCRFLRLAKGGRKVVLTDFQSVPELAGNPFIMRIFELFDADRDGCVNFEEFIHAVESFGRLYTSEDKCMCKQLYLLTCLLPACFAHKVLMCYFACVIFRMSHAVAFRMYDLDGDGYISPEELAHTLKTLMGRALSELQLSQIVECTIMQHDVDGDGRLSFQEFTSLLTAADTENKLCAAF